MRFIMIVALWLCTGQNIAMADDTLSGVEVQKVQNPNWALMQPDNSGVGIGKEAITAFVNALADRSSQKGSTISSQIKEYNPEHGKVSGDQETQKSVDSSTNQTVCGISVQSKTSTDPTTKRRQIITNIKPASSSAAKSLDFSIRTEVTQRREDKEVERNQIHPPSFKLSTLVEFLQKNGCSYKLAQSTKYFFALVMESNPTVSSHPVCDNLSISCEEIQELQSYGTSEYIITSMIKASLKKDGYDSSLASKCYQQCTRK